MKKVSLHAGSTGVALHGASTSTCAGPLVLKATGIDFNLKPILHGRTLSRARFFATTALASMSMLVIGVSARGEPSQSAPGAYKIGVAAEPVLLPAGYSITEVAKSPDPETNSKSPSTPSTATPPAPTQTAAPTQSSAPTQTSARSELEKVLLEQATYWRGQSQPSRAIQSLERLLTVSPNADALSLLARAQMDDGKVDAARKTLERLRTEYKGDPRIAEIEHDLEVGQPDPTLMEQARSLAQQGRPSQAVQSYQQAFKGPTPPNQYASEYYQTLGGTAAGFEPAREGLGKLVVANPRDARAQLAYARLLSYDEGTRDEAIERLGLLARSTSIGLEADRALRQALQWLPDTPESLKPVELYASRHPEDTQISEKLALIRNPKFSPVELAGQARASGFDKMEKKLLVEAEQEFQKALTINADDADATAGLGFLRMKQGRMDEGRVLLKRAQELGPTDNQGIEAALKSMEPSAASGGVVVDEAKLREIRAEYARVARLTQRGRYAEAEALLIRLAGPEPDWGNYLQLGGIQALAGKTHEAEASFRRALSMKPGNPAATIGLAGVLLRQNRVREAEALYAQVGDFRTVGRMRAERLRSQARGVTDPVAQAGLYRAAVQADPSNPWLRLELARALLRQGRGDDARAVMAAIDNSGNPQAAEAGFYFSVEVNDVPRAAALAALVPAAKRTPQMVAVQQRVAVRAEIAQAAQGANSPLLRARLISLAAVPDESGARVEEIARTLVALNDRSGAVDAIATAMATAPAPSVQQRVAYAGALAGASRELEAEQMLAGIDKSELSRDQRQAVGSTENYITAAVSDRLRLDGRYDEAFQRLARRLQNDPSSQALNLALARLYIGRAELGRAVAITRELLDRNPSDLDVRRAAVDALIAIGDLGGADVMALEGIRNAPGDARAYMISARVARQLDENGRVMQNLRAAHELIRAKGGDDGLIAAGFDARGADASQVVASDPTSPSTLPAGTGRDAFRPGSSIVNPSGQVPDILSDAGLALADPLGRRLERDIATLQDEVAPQVRAGLGFLGRTGEGGLSKLNVVTVPIEASFSPGGIGRLRLQVTPTLIDSGTARDDSRARLQRFGTNPLLAALGLPLAPADRQRGEGVGLNVAYTYRFATVDVGTTPLGFTRANVVGGVEFAPLLTPDLRVRFTADRRAIANSVLSYAGARDPVTGLIWGAVVRNRGYTQLEWSPGRWFLYGGAGGGLVTGERVRRNAFIEAAGGVSYGVFIDGPQELRIGVSSSYANYAQNQNSFAFGNGGYFSPQNYVSVQLPITWRDQPTDNFSYKLGGAIGYQWFAQRAAAVFPNDPLLQLQLGTAGTGTSAFVTGTQSRGLSYSATADFEYKVSDAWRFGGRAAFQRAGDYNEGSALLYGRYLFNLVNR